MALRALLSLPGHIIKLFYGVAAVGLAGALALGWSSDGVDGRASSIGAATATQEPRAQNFTQVLTRPEPRAFIVLVASEEQASRVRAEVGNVGEYYGQSNLAAPSIFLVARTPQEASLVRTLLTGDQTRFLIDLLPQQEVVAVRTSTP